METILKVYSGAHVACQVCVWRQLQVCCMCSGQSAFRWALVKSSVALHGVGAAVGSHGEMNLGLWSSNSAPFWLLHWRDTLDCPGLGHRPWLRGFFCAGHFSARLSLVQFGRFFGVACAWGVTERFFICVSELSNCWCWGTWENSVVME